MNIAAYYSRFSELYDVRNETTMHVSAGAVDKFVSALRPNSHILDAGCGPGKEASYFKSKGHRITGVDISPGMVARFQEKLPDSAAIVGDVTSMPQFSDQTFDALFCGNVLLHLNADNGKTALCEYKRVLKKRGLLFVATMCGDGTSDTYTHMSARELGLDPIYFYYWQRGDLVQYLRQTGFSVIFEDTVKPYEHRPSILSLTCRKDD